ncbi:uncharacterized protein CC84DRAFT_1215790 [Paraphaeosphaeria sporulosa]|uniref:F-box domain-containing protein n=1 Tax=Paraphaeosphaeria sporulosa TaxID=1460663 RepID=A0A177CIV8_9PLEO|nr:uncharacterized protein CC84DRAFT_1215790 [Paraphaeosphaeria sporulosa]OAG06760.1 hypothetical protein CC84DRAFT_1215790 [Paraphaeosphaeria sporulosa]
MNTSWAVATPPAREEEPASAIESLPNELLQLVFGFLPSAALREAALVSTCFHRHATDFLWQHVNLMDKPHFYENENFMDIVPDRSTGETDQHDDTPIIFKLSILATNPTIASKVQVLTHRCHLPTPNIFSELPHMHFDSENLSQDNRIHTLLWLAIRNLTNVHTLRIVYGHYNLTRILLAAFLDKRRPQRVPLRKLWVESSCLSGFETNYNDLLSPEYATGLESVRIRRLRVELETPSERSKAQFEYRLARGGRSLAMHNAAGGFLHTTVDIHAFPARLPATVVLPTPAELRAKADAYDTLIWDRLNFDGPEIQHFVDSNQFPCPNLKSGPSNSMMNIIGKSWSTLTSLNLDWILWRQHGSTDDTQAISDLRQLSQLRFPNLRSFQLRNAVVDETGLPDGVFLLEDMFLTFMEVHTKIQCLAWPLDRVYSHVKPSSDVLIRARAVVAHLRNVLVELRLDSFYSGNGEMNTDEGREPHEREERVRRRRFISEFAAHMRKIEQLKLEGGIPRDEKRELVRALHQCQLKKLVLIGVTFPIGNTWGARGIDLKQHDPNHVSDATYQLEEEDFDGILASYKNGTVISNDCSFEPYYGWRAEAPFMQCIALHHASTIEELKLCGYNGSPILSYLTPITTPLLYPLRHFDNLKQLVISFWLLTTFEDQYRDAEIIQSWMDTRSPASTALVVVTPPATPPIAPPVDPAMMPRARNQTSRQQNFNRWAVTLKTRFTPSALAYRVAEDIAPHLSEVAKARPGGVRVRASFCLGTREESRSANDIFDLDIRIGRQGKVLEFIGPREEAEKGRFWQKLERRRWF